MISYKDATPAELAEEKKFYQRFYALHNDSVLTDIVRQFGPSVLRRSSVCEGFEEFIRDNAFRGKCCVEIGTYKGLTAIVLSRYFNEVVTIDVVPDPEREQIAGHCGVENIRFVTVNGNAEKAALVKGLTFDAAYVDGDHANDTDADFSLVCRCGRVLIHEYWQAQPPVWNLVQALQRGGSNVVTQGKFALWTR